MQKNTPITSHTKGIILTILASLFLASMGVGVHLLHHIPFSEMLFARFFLSFLILLPILFCVPKHKRPPLKTKRPVFLLIRCILGYTSMVLLFFNIQHMHLADAVLFLNTGPIFVPFIVWACLKIPTNRWVILSGVISLVGVAIVLDPHHMHSPWYALTGILSGFIAGCCFVIIRQLCLNEHPKTLLFYFFAFGSIVSFISMLFMWKTPSSTDLIILLSIGIFGALFQICITYALKYITSRAMSPILYFEVVFAALFGCFIFGDTLDIYFYIGSILIFLGVINIIRLKSHTDSKLNKSHKNTQN